MVEKYYTVEQIAAMIDLHPKTIQRYIREGRLKAQKLGKAWRVSGHDLSTFIEGTDDIVNHDAPSGLQAIIGESMGNIKVSAVLDVPVKCNAEASLVANWIAASMNAQSSDAVYTSMTSQYIEPEKIIRIMLWGSPAFIGVIMTSISDLHV